MNTCAVIRAARLRYIAGDTPGWSRKRRGRGFTYHDEHGETIRDPEIRAWIESLVIPPAWEDVWISPYRNGHILATGRDSKGRKQYRYHPAWIELRSRHKFDELAQFGALLPRIRAITDEHLRQPALSRTRVLAALIRLLERTLIRVGSREYAAANDSYGLTTLQDDHAQVEGSKVSFEFVGKSGKAQQITLQDRRLARVVKRCRDIPGYELFQYIDENGQQQVIDSADVNAYLEAISGQPFTAKVFRTWGASALAVKYLAEDCAETESRQGVQSCVAHVAHCLGNTKAVCRKYYIHPAVLDAYVQGTLLPVYQRCKRETGPSPLALMPEERTLIALMRG